MDPTSHGPPLTGGPCSPDVMIGFMAAWRALPAGMGAGLEQASDTMNQLMTSPTLDPGSTPAKLAQVNAGLMQDAGPAAAKGAPGATAAVASGFSALMTANVALTATYTAAAAVPGGQPAAMTAYTEGIKAAAAAFASAAMASLAGVTDIHTCPIPVPIPPHGPGVVTKGSKSVLINNLPPARKDDKVIEAAGGADPIAMGCPTVLIGDDGGGPAPAPAAAAPASAAPTQEAVEQQSQAQSSAAALANAAAIGLALVQICPQCERLKQAAQKQKHRIAVRVVNDITDEPIAGIVLKLTLPDGRVEPHTTDGNGQIEVDDLDTPGACSVTCDIKGARLATTFDFVAMGEARVTPADATAGAEGSRTAGKTIAQIEEHKVSTGESIKSLADQNGMTWQELALFNWDTAVPDQINEHLRDDVGCTRRTRDGYNYVFDDRDDPGIIFIPRSWSQAGLQTDQTHTVRVIGLTWPRAWIRLEIEPSDAAALSDCFVLSSMDGVYSSEKTVKDDQVPGDHYIDLRYSRLRRDKSYKLVVTSTQGGTPFTVFEDVPYEQLVGLSPAQGPEAREEAPEVVPAEAEPDELDQADDQQQQQGGALADDASTAV